MSEILDIFRHLRIKICNASESGPVTVFRWNGEREKPFLMVHELAQALSNGLKEMLFSLFRSARRGRQIKLSKYREFLAW